MNDDDLAEKMLDAALSVREHGGTMEASMRAALAVVRKHEGWQPIETAPKDGSVVMLWVSPGKIVLARWFEPWAVWLWDGDPTPEPGDERFGIGSKVPTHWCPIPQPPSTKGDNQ